MPKTKKDFEPRKEQLVQTALNVFMEKGYEQTTIVDLQKAFGLTRGGMYHYFSSKEEILDAVIEQGLQKEMEELRGKLAELPLEKRLVYLLFHSAANEFTRKLFLYAKSGNSSFVYHKLREQNIKMAIPLLQEIMRQYVDSGFYACPYPEEMAEQLSLLAASVADVQILPPADLPRQKKRVDALLYMWDCCVKPPQRHLEELKENLYQMLKSREAEYENDRAKTVDSKESW